MKEYDVAQSMQKYLDDANPVPRYMSGVALDMADVANELDLLGSPFAREVDDILMNFVNVLDVR